MRLTMKSIIHLVLAGGFIILCLCGCNQHLQGEYVEYAVSENEELGCVEFKRLDTVFRPYGVIPNSDFRGDQVGKRDDNPDAKICQVNDYPTTEWIIEYDDVLMGGGDMLYKAVGVTDIPDELEQFKQYDY